MNRLLKIKKCGRICYSFPWESSQLPQPWPNTHERVVLPMTASERRLSKKCCHVQVIAKRNLDAVREVRLELR